jgi:hypothetical protein
VSDRSEHVQDHLLQALAGAVMLRDRLAEAGDGEGTHLALLTVQALNEVFGALSMEQPSGMARLLPRASRQPLAPGFAAP